MKRTTPEWLQPFVQKCERYGVGGRRRAPTEFIPEPNLHGPLKQVLARYEGGSIRDPRLQRVAESWTWGGGSLLLLGPTDSGKTTAALDIVRRLVKAARAPEDVRRVDSIVYAHSTHLVTAGWSTSEAMAFIRRCGECRLLVLDDLGWDQAGTAKNNPIPGILHERHTRRLPTFVTSGETFENLSAAYGGAVPKRILDACSGGVLVDLHQGEPEANDNKSRAVGS